jgi:hypothetical protein
MHFEFSCSWGYKLLDFEQGGIEEEELEDDEDDYERICSCCFEDEELRAYVIKTPGLNDTRLLSKLRRFLFGSSSDLSKQETCNDYEFLILLFASMGTFDYDTIWTTEGIGWVWSPKIYYAYDTAEDKQLREAMIQDKVMRPGEHEGWYSSDVYDLQVPGLEYHIRNLSNTLRPIDRYYRPPRRQDAVGYYPPCSDNDDDYDGSSDDDEE